MFLRCDPRCAAAVALFVACLSSCSTKSANRPEPEVLIEDDRPASHSGSFYPPEFESGTVSVGALKKMLRSLGDSVSRPVLALNLEARGEPRRRNIGLSFLPAKALLEMDPIEAARLYEEWRVPARAAEILLNNGATLARVPDGYEMLVRTCLHAGDTVAAAAYLDRVLAATEDDEILGFACATLHGERLLRLLERIAEDTAPSTARAEMTAALPNLYVRAAFDARGDARACAHFIRKALARGDIPAEAWYNIAMIHSLNRDVDSALEAVTRSLEKNGNDLDALILSANLHSRKGRHAEAVAAYRKAMELGASASALKDFALLLLNHGDTPASLRVIAAAHAKDKLDPRIARTYGLTAVGLKSWREAAEPIESAHRSFPRDEEVARAYAVTMIEIGRIDEAVNAARTVTDRDARMEIIARARLAGGDYDEAKRLLRPVRNTPRFTTLYARSLEGVSERLLSQGDLAAASLLWREWLAIDSTASIPRTMLAEAASAAHEAPSKQVANIPEKPAEIVPIPSMSEVAEAFSRAEYEKAEALAESFLSSNPSSAAGWKMLALARAKRGRNESAVAALEQSLLLTEDPVVRAAMIELKSRSGQ